MHNIQPEELRLENSYKSFYSTLGAAATIIGIASVGVLVMGGGLTELAAAWVGLGSIWLVMALVIGLNNRRLVQRERRDAETLFEGDCWARWQWSADEWQRELAQRRVDLEKHLRFQRFAPWIGGVAGLVIGGCFLFIAFVAGEAMPAPARTFMMGLGLFFACLSVGLSLSGARRERYKWQSRLERAEQAATPRIWLGPYGFYHETDGHTTLRNLTAVSFSSRKQQLAFQIKHPGPKGSTLYQTVPLPVPEAHTADAAALVTRYRTERQLHN